MSHVFLSLMALLCSSLALSAPAKKAEWNIFFYMGSDTGAGDDELLEPTKFFLRTLRKTKGLSADGDVRVILQLDESGEDPNYRYLVTEQKGREKLEPIPEEAVREIVPGFRYQERDSGNVLTLKEFIVWAAKAYPAEHTMLVMGGHSWGTSGIIQDFFKNSLTLDLSTIIKLYEIRRAMEEIYAEHPLLFPAGRIDVFFSDSCIMGQLDVALEFQNVFNYFSASSVEMPFHSLPYNKILEELIYGVGYAKKHKNVNVVEDYLLKPLVTLFAKDHGPEGQLAKLEGQVDVFNAFAIRTSQLKYLKESLTALAKLLVTDTYKDERKAIYRELARATDADHYADIFYAMELLKREFAGKEDQGPKWKDALAAVVRVQQSLGFRAKDSIVRPTEIAMEKGEGAFVHVQVDPIVKGREILACLIFKNLITANREEKDLIPTGFFDVAEKGKREKLDLEDVDCYERAMEVKYRPDKRVATLKRPWKITEFLKIEVEYPKEGLPPFLSESRWEDLPVQSPKPGDYIDGTRIGKRVLSLWVPKKLKPGKEEKRQVLVSFPGARKIQIDEVSETPEDYSPRTEAYRRTVLKQKSIAIEPYRIVTDDKELKIPFAPKEAGLYVANAQSQGSFHKNGLGIYFRRSYDPDGYYAGGREPIEVVEKREGKKKTLSSYFKELQDAKKEDEMTINGNAFYKLHRIDETGWPDFIFKQD